MKKKITREEIKKTKQKKTAKKKKKPTKQNTNNFRSEAIPTPDSARAFPCK